MEVVVKVGGREVGGGGNVAHAGFRKAAYTKLFSGSAQDLQAAGKIAPANTALAPACDLGV